LTLPSRSRFDRAVFHWKPRGSTRWTFGVYAWGRTTRTKRDRVSSFVRGYVLRVGPLGHVQLQWFKALPEDGRVPRRSYMVSWWGVRGRRAKRYVELSVGRRG
jgi:hypothetical protein